MESNQFKIYSLKMAHKLAEAGCHCIGHEPHRTKPWLNVFIFENTERLHILLTKFTQEEVK